MTIKCKVCNGSGIVAEDKCIFCAGKGRYPVQVDVDIDPPCGEVIEVDLKCSQTKRKGSRSSQNLK